MKGAKKDYMKTIYQNLNAKKKDQEGVDANAALRRDQKVVWDKKKKTRVAVPHLTEAIPVS